MEISATELKRLLENNNRLISAMCAEIDEAQEGLDFIKKELLDAAESNGKNIAEEVKVICSVFVQVDEHLQRAMSTDFVFLQDKKKPSRRNDNHG